jgi:hypothetical protein
MPKLARSRTCIHTNLKLRFAPIYDDEAFPTRHGRLLCLYRAVMIPRVGPAEWSCSNQTPMFGGAGTTDLLTVPIQSTPSLDF